MKTTFVPSITNSRYKCAAILSAVAIVPLLAPTPAQAAFFVTVDDHLWKISTVTGAFNDGTNVGGVNLTKNTFQKEGEQGAPWFGSSGKAAEFADKVGGHLGFPNFSTPNFPNLGIERGPVFVYLKVEDPESPLSFGRSVFGWTVRQRTGNTIINRSFPDINTTYATATKVPGPLPILGTAAAFGYSRKLRKRIKSSTNAIATTPRA